MNEKPFECHIGDCKEKFRTKGNLMEHLKTRKHSNLIGENNNWKELLEKMIESDQIRISKVKVMEAKN